jgi:hypothetical protein
MLTSLIQQAPAETTNYLIAGYVVIFGVMLLYIVSLIVRTHNLKRELQLLVELEDKEK